MLSMVRLKNIKINDRTAEADYFPEDSITPGHIVVDLSSEEIVSVTNVAGYEPPYGASHRGHALWTLVEMAKTDDTSTERLVMWY